MNYLNYMMSQYQAITHHDPDVLVAINHASLKQLESRAPAMSTADHDFILERFESKDFLPGLLSDTKLREKVKDAVCQSRGPFLTFQTLAEDLRVMLRIQDRLRAFLGTGLRRDSDCEGDSDTARQKMEVYFMNKYTKLQLASSPVPARFSTPKAFATHCYELLFLHMMRTAASKIPIVEQQLDDLVRRVFGDNVHDLDNAMVTDSAIEIDPPEGWLSMAVNSQDVPLAKRHGPALFKDPAATHLLFHNQLCAPYAPGTSVSPASMGRDIVSILLHGTPLAPASESSAASCVSNSVRRVTEALSSYRSDSPEENHDCSSSRCSPRISTTGWSVLSEKQAAVTWGRPRIVEKNTIVGGPSAARSEVALWDTLDNSDTMSLRRGSKRLKVSTPVALLHTSSETTSGNHTHVARLDSIDSAQIPSQTADTGLRGAGIQMDYAPLHHRAELYSSPVSRSEYSRVLSSTQSPQLNGDLLSTPKRAQFYLDLIPDNTSTHNTPTPYPNSEGVTIGLHGTLSSGNQKEAVGNRLKPESVSFRHSAKTLTERISLVDPQNTTSTVFSPDFITFEAVDKEPEDHQFCHVEVIFDESIVKAFFDNQMELDSKSTFWYWQSSEESPLSKTEEPGKNGQNSTRKVIVNSEQAFNTIQRHFLHTVFVESTKLAATERPQSLN